MIKHTKADIDIDVKVYLREKKGYYYAVLVYKNISGARREKWVATKLTVRGNKTKAKSVCDQLLHDFEIPDEDIYLQDVRVQNKSSIVDNTVKVEMIPPEILENATFHDLRHTCASLLLNKGKHNGITLKDIQVWLGHSDFATTANIYSHLDASSKVSSLDTLSNIVSIE